MQSQHLTGRTRPASHSRGPVQHQCPRQPCAHRTHRKQALHAVASPSSVISYTQQVFEKLDAASAGSAAGGAGGTTTWNALLRADDAWYKMRNQPDGPIDAGPPFVTVSASPLPCANPAASDAAAPAAAAASTSSGAAARDSGVWDVIVCGGTLGIFVAAALAQRGARVCVLERGPLRGRSQEWNLSRKEMNELIEMGLLTSQEADRAILHEFNPVRVGFLGSPDIWTRDVLNCGVSPDVLIQQMRDKVTQCGGVVLDNTPLQVVTAHSDGVQLQLGNGSNVRTRLVLDCMGHQSPIVRQIRQGRKPDGVCVVVGTCASGFKDNSTADVIYTNSDLQPQTSRTPKAQLFWEAFPAASGPEDRTTYMFTYMDASPWRPSIQDLFEDYWQLMARYQNVRLEDLTFQRALFGLFPTYRDSPLEPGFDRVMQIGDASGIQSPLSFGGFGALTRHLKRLTNAVCDALETDSLDKDSLACIHGYNPGLSSSWMLQRAMSVREKDKLNPNLINKMLGGNFQAMERLGDPVLKPFLQDVIQLRPLLQTMTGQMLSDPLTVPELIMHVGPGPLLDWTKHVASLAAYTALYESLGKPLRALADSNDNPLLTAKSRYRLRRCVDSWEYGAGLDYKL